MDEELKEKLKESKCGGCFRNCSLLYPMCEIGQAKAKKLLQKNKPL